jgi:hypothetical protein
MAQAEPDEWTVVGRNNRPRRTHTEKPAAAAAAAPPAAAADAAPAATTARLPGWGGGASASAGSKRRSPPTEAAGAAAPKRASSHSQNHRPGRRREREPPPSAAAAARGADGTSDDDDGDDRSRERRCALHLGRVREAAAEVARSDMWRGLRAVMASAGGGAERAEGEKTEAEAAAAEGGNGNGSGSSGNGHGGFPWASVSELVVYGLGSLEDSRVSRHQAALATLLASPEVLPRVARRAAEVAARAEARAAEGAEDDGGGEEAAAAAAAAAARDDDGAADPPPRPPPPRGGLVAYDPCFSRVDRRVLARLGARPLPRDERCARRAAAPAALFYLPHLEVRLTELLLAANWTRARLRRTAILSNAFSAHAERLAAPASLRGGGPGGDEVWRLPALVAAGALAERPVPEAAYGVPSAFNDAALHTFCDVSDAAFEAAGVPDGDDDDDDE